VTLRSPATLAVMTSPAPALGPWSGRPPSPPGWRRENMATGRAHTAQQNVVIAAMRRPTLGSSMKEAGLRAVRFEKRRNWRRFLGHVGLEASKLRGGVATKVAVSALRRAPATRRPVIHRLLPGCDTAAQPAGRRASRRSLLARP
jgi:hypothetical protein